MSDTKKKVVYCAGRMRGLPYYGFPAFDAARDRLVKLGFEVLSPADMDRAEGFDPTLWNPRAIAHWNAINWSDVPSFFDLAAAIERDNKAIDSADAIYVIHEGISESAGGMAEIERGMKAGKIIVYDTMSDEVILKALGVEPLTNIQLLDAAIAVGQQPRYTEREGVLDEAKKLITGDRNASYGPPTQDFQRTADMMSALFSAKLKDGERFKPSDVAWIITLVKASRAQHSPKRDNYVDAAGYMGCGWECEAETLKRETPGV